MPEGKHPRIRTHLPLVLILVLLISLILVPVYSQQRIAELNDITADVAEPARRLISDIQVNFARETANTRGFLLTGDSSLAIAHLTARAERHRAYDKLLPLTRRLGPRPYAETLRLGAFMMPADQVLDSLYAGLIPTEDYIERLPIQQARFEAVTASAVRIDDLIGEVVVSLVDRATRVEDITSRIIIALAMLSIMAALLVAQLGRSYRRLADRLERRARWRESLNEATRELGAASTLDEVVNSAVTRAVATTRAFGAYIELVDEGVPEGDVEIAAVAGLGCPPVHTRVPYPGSLSEKAIQSGDADVVGEISGVGKNMAAYLRESCRDCTALILPLSSEQRFIGALIMLRNPEQPAFASDEILYMRTLADSTTAAIRRVRLLEQLTAAELKFRQIADHLREVIWLGAPDLSVRLYVNPAYEQVFGRTRQSFYEDPKAPIEMVHPDDRDRIEQEMDGLRRGDYDVEYRIIRPDGSIRWIWARGYPIRDENGNVYRIAGIMEDITEQKRVEREREELLASVRETRDMMINLMEGMQEGFYALDNEARFVYVNREAERILRMSRDDLLGRVIWDVLPGVRNGRSYQHYLRAVRDRELVQFVSHNPELGIWTDVRIFPTAAGVSVLFQDISERHRAEERVRESERNFRALGNSIPQLAWMANPQGRVFWYNQRWFDFTGTDAETMKEVSPSRYLHPDQADRVRSGFLKAIAAGQPWEDTFQLQSRTGEYCWFLSRAVPVRDAHGNITRWFGTNTDITDRINLAREREDLLKRERYARQEAEQRRAELARVTESRATLMRGFGHDVKNPLGAADGYLQLLEEGVIGHLEDKQLESVRNIRRSIRIALALIEDLLAFARAEAGEIDIQLEETDICDVVREAVDEYHAQAEAQGLTLNVETDEGVPLINTDPDRVRQVIANLLSNAVKYTEHGGITVSVHVREDGAAPRPGRWIAIDVRDTGPGIRADQQRLIFNEFRRARTDTTESGAGIGLAIARNIARALNGEISLVSKPGEGSTFTLWLPIT